MSAATNESVEGTALKILHVIETYGLAFERTGHWDGLETFIPTVKSKVEKGEPVTLLLPGFPFKSPNAIDKTLGALPDLGEELALAHLNGLCDNIATVYEHGAEVHVCSDGLVYNDLLGVLDETVFDYGEGVRAIAASKGLTHLRFIRLWDLLEHSGSWDKQYYLTHATGIRNELMDRFGDRNFEADMAAKSDEDVKLTLASYIKFLGKDLAYNSKYTAMNAEEKATAYQGIAKQMMGRWKAFGAALEASRKGFVRLSIHDSPGKGKLTMAPVPQAKGILGSTPWHSCVAVELDGSYRTLPSSEAKETYDLVYQNGRPAFYRAKSPLFDWSEAGLDVSFEHQYPCGLIVRPVVPSGDSAPSIKLIPMEKVRTLSKNFSPIIMRGFAETTDQSIYRTKAAELGEVLSEATGELEKTLSSTGYEYITCISPPPKGSGYTHFVSSRLASRYKGTTGDEAKEPVDVASEGVYDYRTYLRFAWNVGDVLVNDNGSVMHVGRADDAKGDEGMWMVHVD